MFIVSECQNRIYNHEECSCRGPCVHYREGAFVYFYFKFQWLTSKKKKTVCYYIQCRNHRSAHSGEKSYNNILIYLYIYDFQISCIFEIFSFTNLQKKHSFHNESIIFFKSTKNNNIQTYCEIKNPNRLEIYP